MKKLCIFDLDGTLTDTISAIAYFGNLSLEKNGFPAIDRENYKYFAGDGRVELIHRMLKYHNADSEENYNKVCKTYDEAYESNPIYMTKSFAGMDNTIDELKRKGIYIAVCSNKPHNVVCMIVNAVFGNKFDIVKGIDARNNDKTKPDPENVLRIIEKLNLKKEDCIFIGDTNVDIRTAKNAEIESVGVLWGFRDRKELEDSGADYIIESPADLLGLI